MIPFYTHTRFEGLVKTGWYLAKMFPELFVGALIISFGLPHLVETATIAWVFSVVAVVMIVHVIFKYATFKAYQALDAWERRMQINEFGESHVFQSVPDSFFSYLTDD